MNDIELPQELKTSVTEETIQVPIDGMAERTYTPEQLDQLIAAGGIMINRHMLRSLHALGCSVEQTGPLRILKGGIMVGVNGGVAAIQSAQLVVADESEKYSLKQKLEAGRLLGYLMGQMTKTAVGAVKIDQTVAEVVMAADEKKRQSFQPGQRVTINRDEHPIKA